MQLSGSVEAFTFGLSRALESLYFPMYELRARTIDGELYLASSPSAMAERDLAPQLGRMRDSGLRFTRSVRGIWDRAIKREVEEYNDRMEAFARPGVADEEVAAGLVPLRRTRANQWFAATRAIFAPTVMLRHGIGNSSIDDAVAVSEEALAIIRERGSELLEQALFRVGERIVRSGSIEKPEDVQWLDLLETRDALTTRLDRRQVVAARRAQASPQIPTSGPEVVGPALPPDAPRMYMLRDILDLID